MCDATLTATSMMAVLAAIYPVPTFSFRYCWLMNAAKRLNGYQSGLVAFVAACIPGDRFKCGPKSLNFSARDARAHITANRLAMIRIAVCFVVSHRLSLMNAAPFLVFDFEFLYLVVPPSPVSNCL